MAVSVLDVKLGERPHAGHRRQGDRDREIDTHYLITRMESDP